MWDAVSGQCLEAIEGAHDVAAVAAGPSSFPWRARKSGLETIIEEAATGRPLAWLPFTHDDITTHPLGRTWAGAVGEYLCLFTLEGIPTAPADGGSTALQ